MPYYITIVFCLISLTVAEALVVNTPQNVTVLSSSNISLDCSTQSPYTGYFEWKYHSSVTGTQIYYQPPYTPNLKYPAINRCSKVGDFGLGISSVEWKDGGTYGCYFLAEDISKFAIVVIIDNPEAMLSPQEVDVGQNVTVACSVKFGGPLNTSFGDGQFPKLDMYYNGILMNVPLTYDPGQPGTKPHIIKRSATLTATPADSQKVLSCWVATQNPAFTASANKTLMVRVPAYGLSISPRASQYQVFDTITCSALGYPTPEVQWIPVSTPGQSVQPIRGPTLNLTKDMMGSNVWNCTAGNQLNSLAEQISFSVVETVAAEQTAVSSTMVGLAIGICIGISLFLTAIILIVACIVKRRNRQGKQPVEDAESSSHPFIYVPRNPDADEAAPIAKQPVAKPRVASLSTSLDDSQCVSDLSYMGLGQNKKRVNTSVESDGKPQPVERTKNSLTASNQSLDKSFDRPVPAQRPNLRGSTESLDKSFDKPVAAKRPAVGFRGSSESLDQSIDRPQPAQRPKPALRASNESLDRSLDVPRPAQRPKLASHDTSLDSGVRVGDRSRDSTDQSADSQNRLRVAPKPKPKKSMTNNSRAPASDDFSTDV